MTSGTFDAFFGGLSGDDEGTEEERASRELVFGTVRAVLHEWSMQRVAREFGLLLGTCVLTGQKVAQCWIRPFSGGGKTTLAEDLATMLTRVLVEPLDLEITTESGARTHGTLRLFGPHFTIPFDALRDNYVLYACVLRILGQGFVSASTDAQRAFRASEVAEDRGAVTYHNFRFSGDVNNALSRSALVMSICTAFVATALRAASERDDQESAQIDIQASRVVLQQVLRTVELDTMTAAKSNRAKWLGELDFAAITTLLDLCTEPGRYKVREFLHASLLHCQAQHIHRTTSARNAARDRERDTVAALAAKQASDQRLNAAAAAAREANEEEKNRKRQRKT